MISNGTSTEDGSISSPQREEAMPPSANFWNGKMERSMNSMPSGNVNEHGHLKTAGAFNGLSFEESTQQDYAHIAIECIEDMPSKIGAVTSGIVGRDIRLVRSRAPSLSTQWVLEILFHSMRP